MRYDISDKFYVEGAVINAFGIDADVTYSSDINSSSPFLFYETDLKLKVGVNITKRLELNMNFLFGGLSSSDYVDLSTFHNFGLGLQYELYSFADKTLE